MSCVCYGPVQLVGSTPFTVLEHEHVKKIFLYLQKQFSYKVFSIIFNTSEKVVLVIWKVNFYKDHDSSFFFSDYFLSLQYLLVLLWFVDNGSTKTWNPESGIRNHGNGNGNGIQNLWKKVPSDRFGKKYISNDNKINKQIKKRHKWIN